MGGASQAPPYISGSTYCMNVIFWWYVTLDRSSFCEPKNLDLVAMATSYRHFCLPRPQTMNYHNSAVFHAIVFKFYTITHIYHLFRFSGSNGCHGNQKKHLILARLWFWVFSPWLPWQRTMATTQDSVNKVDKCHMDIYHPIYIHNYRSYSSY